MSTAGREGKNPRSRDQALNDSTSGQLGKDPEPDIKPDPEKKRK